MYARGGFENERCCTYACVRSVLTYGAETWAMKVGVFQGLPATGKRTMRMICGVTLKDKVESTVIHREWEWII